MWKIKALDLCLSLERLFDFLAFGGQKKYGMKMEKKKLKFFNFAIKSISSSRRIICHVIALVCFTLCLVCLFLSSYPPELFPSWD